jgi:hypothetical protein
LPKITDELCLGPQITPYKCRFLITPAEKGELGGNQRGLQGVCPSSLEFIVRESGVGNDEAIGKGLENGRNHVGGDRGKTDFRLAI